MPGERQRQEVAALYVSSREGVVRYLIASGLDPDKAEEATQEAFLRLYSAWRDGQRIEQPKAWVYKVARNIAINAAKRGVEQSVFSEAVAATIASPQSSAEEVLIERESAESFREAIARLSQRQRECLELRAQGLRFAEIADVLGIQVSTAGEYVRRGIEELKKWSRSKN
jgi:RNA polymerase sigma-70 factor (ECF subfamily)